MDIKLIRQCFMADGVSGCIGSGGSAPKILRPNLEFINKLRGFPLDMSQRPQSIASIACLDDEPIMIKIYYMSLSKIITANTGKEIELINISDLAVKTADPAKFHIYTACTGEETKQAADQILRSDVNFVITDFNMLGITGAQITSALRGSGYKGYIIGLTGLYEANKHFFYDAGADLVLPKPVDTNTLPPLFV